MFARHPNLTAAFLLLLVAVVLFAPYLTQPTALMWPRSELGTDMLTYNWPSVYFFREALQRDGVIPLWQGTSGGGLPMIGNPAIRVFYPPQLLVSLLPVPILWGYALLNVFHFWLAGMGGFGLARSVMKADYPVALLGGLLVMLTPRLSSNVVGDVGYTHGLCWLPLALLWTRLAFDRQSWRWAIAAGLALCCIYLNNIQYILYAGWLVVLYFVYRCVGLIIDRQPRRVWLGQLGVLVVIGVACIGFSAFQSFTFASYLPYQSRQTMTLADSNYLALPPIVLFNIIFPLAQKFPEWEVYAGLLPLLLAPLAFAKATRRESLWWLVLLVFSVLFSLGTITPLYSLMFYAVPGFGFLRVPARMWYVAAIALAMLTVMAVQAVFRQGKISTRGWRWLWGGAAVILFLTVAGRFLTRRPDELDWLLGFPAAVGVVVSLIALRLWQQGRLKLSVAAAVLCGAVILDLLPVDVAFGRPRPITDFLQTPPVVQTMIEQAGNQPYRVYSLRRAITDPVAVVNHLKTADGLNSFQFADYSGFMRLASGCQLSGLAAAIPPCISNEISETAYLDARPDPTLLGLLNVRYVISPIEINESDLRLIDTESDDHLYENLRVRPRVFTVRVFEIVDDILAHLPEIDPSSVALLDSPPQNIAVSLPISDLSETTTILHESANEIQLEASMPDNGLLVLGDPWTPGWSAEVDGQAAPVLRVDGALRGVHLTSGTHRITFSFRPPAFVIGLLVTVFTVLLCAVLLVWRRNKSIERQ